MAEPNDIQRDDNLLPLFSGVDPNNGIVAAHLVNVTGPDSNGRYYGDLAVSLASGSETVLHVIVDSGTVTSNAGTGFPTAETFTSTLKGLAVEQHVYISGGPPDSTGLPQGPSFNHLRPVTAKVKTTGTITSTLANDTNLVFSSAPKVLQPGQFINLTGGSTAELAVVADSFTPSASATTIPLRNPLVQAGNTVATFDTFGINGPGTSSVTWNAMFPYVPFLSDLSNSQQAFVQSNGNSDTTNGSQISGAVPMLWNNQNSHAERQRPNIDNLNIITEAAVGSGTYFSNDQTNFNGKGCKVFINISAIGTGTVTVSVQGKDPQTGTYFTYVTSTALATTGFTVLTVYPGVTAATNTAVSDALTRTWRVNTVVAMSVGTVSYTVNTAVIV